MYDYLIKKLHEIADGGMALIVCKETCLDAAQALQSLQGELAEREYLCSFTHAVKTAAQVNMLRGALEKIVDMSSGVRFNLYGHSEFCAEMDCINATAQHALVDKPSKECRYKRPTRDIDNCMLGDDLEGCTKSLEEQQSCDRRIKAAEGEPDG